MSSISLSYTSVAKKLNSRWPMEIIYRWNYSDRRRPNSQLNKENSVGQINRLQLERQQETGLLKEAGDWFNTTYVVSFSRQFYFLPHKWFLVGAICSFVDIDAVTTATNLGGLKWKTNSMQYIWWFLLFTSSNSKKQKQNITQARAMKMEGLDCIGWHSPAQVC